MQDATELKVTESNASHLTKNPIHLSYKKNLLSIENFLNLKDSKSLSLIYRQINKYRKGFSDDDISFIVDLSLRQLYNFSTDIIKVLEGTKKKEVGLQFNIPQKLSKPIKEVPEYFLFNMLIVITYLIDKKQIKEAHHALTQITEYLKKNDSNTISYLRAKIYYNYSFTAERLNLFTNTIIAELNSAYRKACLEFDEFTQVTLINCIVRYYLTNDSYEMARNFLSKTKFHENIYTGEDSRHLYYLGRINAIQMNYSEAFINLTNALRKAPESCGQGFKNIVQKTLIIVELLMGEVPDISKYSDNIKHMKPYCDMIRAVKQGNLNQFKIVQDKYENMFNYDKNYNLIQRLRHVVINIGLRKINLSYNRISLTDIKTKLNLENERETEYVVAKAIRDGVFLAKINKDEGFVESLNLKDIYTTFEPQKALHRRILFLNKIYGETMKGLKYSEKVERVKRDVVDAGDDDDFEGDNDFLDF